MDKLIGVFKIWSLKNGYGAILIKTAVLYYNSLQLVCSWAHFSFVTRRWLGIVTMKIRDKCKCCKEETDDSDSEEEFLPPGIIPVKNEDKHQETVPLHTPAVSRSATRFITLEF